MLEASGNLAKRQKKGEVCGMLWRWAIPLFICIIISIHSPHRMLIFASPRNGVRVDMEFRSTLLAPFFPANAVSDGSYTDAYIP